MGQARLVLVVFSLAGCARGTGGSEDMSDAGSGKVDATADSRANDGAGSSDSSDPDSQSGGCNAQSCASGCCSSNTCVAGTSDTECGINGDPCANCMGSNQVCSGQSCSAKPCNKSTCPKGCCSSGSCLAGLSDQACGTGGAQCVNCSQQALVCLNGFCTQ